MRTTVTLDADTEEMVRRFMNERKISFKQAVNDLIRAGARPGPRGTFRTRTAKMGRPVVNLDRALALAADLEDDELVRKQRLGK